MAVEAIHSLALAQKVLKLADHSRHLLTARNCQILFRFLADADLREIEKVDRLLTDKGLNEQFFEQMVRPVPATSGQSEALTEVGVGLEGQVSQVMSLVASARSTTSEYGDSLKAADGQLADATDQTDLKVVINSLVQATLGMEQTAQSLESKLAESSQQIESLNTRLVDLRNQAIMDPLTQIYNRRHFDEMIQNAVDDAEQAGDGFCVCIGDIDLFKQFNDNYGHQVGDQVLRLVARTMMGCARETDVVARYGGEEFAILLPETALETAVQTANRIRETIGSKPLIKRSSGESLGNVTISIGVAQFRRGELREEVMRRADQCLYGAKHAGRNRVVSESEMGSDTARLMADEALAFAR